MVIQIINHALKSSLHKHGRCSMQLLITPMLDNAFAPVKAFVDTPCSVLEQVICHQALFAPPGSGVIICMGLEYTLSYNKHISICIYSTAVYIPTIYSTVLAAYSSAVCNAAVHSSAV